MYISELLSTVWLTACVTSEGLLTLNRSLSPANVLQSFLIRDGKSLSLITITSQASNAKFTKEELKKVCSQLQWADRSVGLPFMCSLVYSEGCVLRGVHHYGSRTQPLCPTE